MLNASAFLLNDSGLIAENTDVGFVGDLGISDIRMCLAAADQCAVTLLKGTLSKSGALLIDRNMLKSLESG